MSGIIVGIKVCTFRKGLNEPITLMYQEAVICRPKCFSTLPGVVIGMHATEPLIVTILHNIVLLEEWLSILKQLHTIQNHRKFKDFFLANEKPDL